MAKIGEFGESRSRIRRGSKAAGPHDDTLNQAYAALIGDIVGSRGLENRAQVQSRLVSTLEELESRFRTSLSGHLVLVRGDEIQGLFEQPVTAVDVVRELAERLHPVQIAWGLGHGSLSTDLRSDPGMMDGPCFHHARRAMETAHRKGAWLCARGFGSPHDAVLSALFHLMGALRSRWTERQNEVVRAARHTLQKHVAEELEVSPSVVSESLKAAAFAAILDAEAAATEILEKFGEKAESAGSSAKKPIPGTKVA